MPEQFMQKHPKMRSCPDSLRTAAGLAFVSALTTIFSLWRTSQWKTQKLPLYLVDGHVPATEVISICEEDFWFLDHGFPCPQNCFSMLL